MRRTLEKLASDRQDKEAALAGNLEDLRKKWDAESLEKTRFRVKHLRSRLQELSKQAERPAGKTRRLLRIFSGKRQEGIPQTPLNEQLIHLLGEYQELIEYNLRLTEDLFTSLDHLIRLSSDLADARDREWDALGNNHLGVIFKSLEGRVDRLAAECEDARNLMKKVPRLRDNLDNLLAGLEARRSPSPQEIRSILTPLEDWRYAGFENRFRGSEEDVKKQLEKYLDFFSKDGKVVDLGCGRGEFLELLRDKGVQALGVDANEQMVAICLDKGLNCRRGDILEKLAELEDASLAGIFSSQVIEHLPPPYLEKLVALCQAKISSGGTLVLETINPTSVFTLVQVYYLDPSHQKPVHPQALKFLLEGAGFEDVEITYSSPLEQEKLQNFPAADERAAVLNRNIDVLNELLFSPPNYAAVGRKA